MNVAGSIYRFVPLMALAVCPLRAAAQGVDTVRVGDPALGGAAPVPGVYVIENHRRDAGVDSLTGTTRQEVRRGQADGVAVWIVAFEHVSGDTTRSSIVVRADDLSLLHYRVKAPRDSAAVTADAGYLTGWTVLPEQAPQLLDRELEAPVFPIEGQVPWLFPLLPLREGYAAAIPHFNPWRGDETWSEIRVLGTETIQLHGRDVACWKVDGGELFRGYRVTYWVDRETRRVVRSEARGEGAGPLFWAELAP
ncbi:MAG: hypothetical protein PVF05_07150 [Gemmatimonadales bacterium]|jgi:hypothetical protein